MNVEYLNTLNLFFAAVLAGVGVPLSGGSGLSTPVRATRFDVFSLDPIGVIFSYHVFGKPTVSALRGAKPGGAFAFLDDTLVIPERLPAHFARGLDIILRSLCGWLWNAFRKGTRALFRTRGWVAVYPTIKPFPAYLAHKLGPFAFVLMSALVVPGAFLATVFSALGYACSKIFATMGTCNNLPLLLVDVTALLIATYLVFMLGGNLKRPMALGAKLINHFDVSVTSPGYEVGALPGKQRLSVVNYSTQARLIIPHCEVNGVGNIGFGE